MTRSWSRAIWSAICLCTSGRSAGSQAVRAGAGLAVVADSGAKRLYTSISIGDSTLAFGYAGRIWSVSRSGGAAVRIDTTETNQVYPALSPDGKRIAYSRLANGVLHVYVASVPGGVPHQLTYGTASDRVRCWSPDGARVLFSSARAHPVTSRLYSVPATGGWVRVLPPSEAEAAAFSSDGAQLVYESRSVFEPTFRDYRGGQTSRLSAWSVATGRFVLLTSGVANERSPMWLGADLYFLSDRGGTYNLYRRQWGKSTAFQVTRCAGFGIRNAASGFGVVAFVSDGGIYTYDPHGMRIRQVPIVVRPDTSERASRVIDAQRFIQSVSLDSSGGVAVFGARGRIWLVDITSGKIARQVASTGGREVDPVVSPDGHSVAFFSDATGAYALYVRALDASGRIRRIPIDGSQASFGELTWSPDGTRVAFSDSHGRLWYADVAHGDTHPVDSLDTVFRNRFHPSWSPDGRVLAYERPVAQGFRAIVVSDPRSRRREMGTDGRSDATWPNWTGDGGALMYLSSSDAPLGDAFSIGDELGAPIVTRRIVVQGRVPRTLPFGIRDYRELHAGSGGVWFVANEWPSTPRVGDTASVLYYAPAGERQRPRRVGPVSSAVSISANRRYALYATEGKWFVASDSADTITSREVHLDSAVLTIDIATEWRRIYDEAWRVFRDQFYDPRYHGQPIDSIERHYAAYLPTITRRSDLNALILTSIEEVGVSHLYPEGGDERGASRTAGDRDGTLGVTYTVDSGVVRIARVLRSSIGYGTGDDVVAPLDVPGSEVADGEFLFEVNDRRVDPMLNVDSYFAGTALKETRIRVGPNANGVGSREVTVRPLPSQRALLWSAWIAERRHIVDSLSHGRLAYVSVPLMDAHGLESFLRDVFSARGCDGLIIDDRYDFGGETGDMFIDVLRRKSLYTYATRYGRHVPYPLTSVPSAQVMVINHWDGSAGETLPLMFKEAGLGPLIGTRTAGAGAGPLDPFVFVDGGTLDVPVRSAYVSSAGWLENAGVAPDIRVEDDASSGPRGRDAQLEAAVRVALELARRAHRSRRPPAYPVH